MMSLFFPYAIYQTAAIQLSLATRTQNVAFRISAESMVKILTCMSKRWHIAGKGKALETLVCERRD